MELSFQSAFSFQLIRRLTYLEGIFFAIMVATTESYALYYFTKNGLSNSETATLATFPLFAGALAQLSIPWVTRKWHLGITLVLAMALQALGIAFILNSLLVPGPFWKLLVSFIFYWAGGQISAPIWMDWVARVVPSKAFPRYLGRRNTLVTFVILCFYVSCSFLLKEKSSYIMLFAAGLGARILSILLQIVLIIKFPAKKILSKEEKDEENTAQFPNMIPRDRKIIFIKFFLIGGLFRMACNVCSPFFMPYMIKDLKLDTVSYVFLTAIPYIGRALFLQNWGKASKGIRPFWGAQIATFFIALLPLLWLLGNNFYYLSFLQILSGIFWGGMEITIILVIQNIYYGRSRFLMSIQNAIFVFFTVIGSMLGAYLLNLGMNYLDLFLISGVIRILVAVAFIWIMTRHHLLSLHRWNARVYLTSILSLRPSLGNVGRLILAPRVGSDYKKE